VRRRREPDWNHNESHVSTIACGDKYAIGANNRVENGASSSRDGSTCDRCELLRIEPDATDGVDPREPSQPLGAPVRKANNGESRLMVEHEPTRRPHQSKQAGNERVVVDRVSPLHEEEPSVLGSGPATSMDAPNRSAMVIGPPPSASPVRSTFRPCSSTLALSWRRCPDRAPPVVRRCERPFHGVGSRTSGRFRTPLRAQSTRRGRRAVSGVRRSVRPEATVQRRSSRDQFNQRVEIGDAGAAEPFDDRRAVLGVDVDDCPPERFHAGSLVVGLGLLRLAGVVGFGIL